MSASLSSRDRQGIEERLLRLFESLNIEWNDAVKAKVTKCRNHPERQTQIYTTEAIARLQGQHGS